MKRWMICVLLGLMLAACRPAEPTSTPTMTTEAATATATQAPTLSPTPEPVERLTICTSSLPDSLFLYDGINPQSKRMLLAMTQEQSFNQVDDALMPGILQAVPAQADGTLVVGPISVQPGQTIVDANAELAVFKPGVFVRPAGCRESACAVIWDGVLPFEMDQMRLVFELRSDLAWSDGKAVTAADSVLSYQLAAAPIAPGLHWAEDRTDDYAALDEQTVQWLGRPGFTTAALERFFWMPLPSHLFSETPALAEAAAQPDIAAGRVSFGPFFVQTKEDTGMLLSRNTHYYRTAEGLPYYDEIFLKVIDEGSQAAWDALQGGVCQLLDASFRWDVSSWLLAEILEDDRFDVVFQPGDVWEQLVLGIQPASYDEYYNPVYGDRPDIFGDVRVRQAVSFCVDREALLEIALPGRVTLWDSFLPPGQSDLTEDLFYDPSEGALLLDLAGWNDHDLDSTTPRQAWEVANVPPGTLLQLDLYTPQSGLRFEIAQILQTSLMGCGIGVNLQPLPLEDLFAPGAGAPLFGRRFDLALLSWQPLPGPDCGYYQSWQIPNAANDWIGTNLAGLSDPSYDQACAEAALALPGEALTGIEMAVRQYQDQLPSVPLFNVSDVLVLSQGYCLDLSQTALKNPFEVIESFMDDKNCP
jgi:peptide/nickel transport system substrate-binding protein